MIKPLFVAKGCTKCGGDLRWDDSERLWERYVCYQCGGSYPEEPAGEQLVQILGNLQKRRKAARPGIVRGLW